MVERNPDETPEDLDALEPPDPDDIPLDPAEARSKLDGQLATGGPNSL